MLFNSIQFLVFFPIVVLVYFLIPKKWQWIWLLITSYYFYMGWNPKYAGLLLFSTFVTYGSGILIAWTNHNEKLRHKDRVKKLWVALSFILNLSILFLFKYFDFALDMINQLLGRVNISMVEVKFDVILPVGISFFTFQALSYTADIYRGEIDVEKNFGKYALFVSFFPQLVAGPIERSGNLLKQINEEHSFNYERAREGVLIMCWGLFLKIVIADRVAILVNQVYNGYQSYSGFAILMAVLFFSIQIYCDFAGYSTIAIGAARIMGFSLMENFNKPYVATSIKEFWRRWHISLSTWFKDYLYVPLGGNRKGKIRTDINIMLVFVVSGLWHGASMNFIVWGFLHGLLQLVGHRLEPIKAMIHRGFVRCKLEKIHRFLQRITTFTIISLLWIFFYASNLSHAIGIFENLFSEFNPQIFFDNSLYSLGLNRQNFYISVMAICLLVIVEFLRGKGLMKCIVSQNIFVRWGIYIGTILTLLIFGAYGSTYTGTEFIYFQF